MAAFIDENHVVVDTRIFCIIKILFSHTRLSARIWPEVECRNLRLKRTFYEFGTKSPGKVIFSDPTNNAQKCNYHAEIPL